MPSMPYVRRVIDDQLDELLPELPAIALEGAKGVGKTATATRRAQTVHALDRPGALDLAIGDPYRLLRGAPPVLIDEWQRLPSSWDLVRKAVDDEPAASKFLLTGSATPRDPGTHSGAGRIVRMRMRPLTLSERLNGSASVSLADLLDGRRDAVDGSTELALDDYAREVCASGLPGLRGLSDRARCAQLDGYLEQIVDRDFPDMDHTLRNPDTVRNWLRAYAAATATAASYEAVRDAATPGEAEKPAKATTNLYRDILQRLWILDPLPAWLPTRSHLRRLGGAPRHHLVDPALAARLLNADAGALLDARASASPAIRDGTLLGQLFESLVSLDVRVYAEAAGARARHLRTHGGEHEVDLIVERPDHRVIAIEVKLARTVNERDVRHLHWLADRLGDDLLDMLVITTGSDAYRRRDGVAVVPAALLGP